MRILIGFILVLSASFANTDVQCDVVIKRNKYKENLPSVMTKEKLNIDLPIIKGGVIQCIHDNFYNSTRSNVIHREEVGEYDGLKYSIFYMSELGLGSLQGIEESNLSSDYDSDNWLFWCNIRANRDEKMRCHIHRDKLSIIFLGDEIEVRVGKNHLSGSVTTIRIDEGNLYTTVEEGRFSQEDSEKIFNEMLTGSKVTTRYQELPYEINIDSTKDLYKFDSAAVLFKMYRDAVKENK